MKLLAVFALLLTLSVSNAFSANNGMSTADVVEALNPSTVAIIAHLQDGTESAGSGVIVDPTGIVVTNIHVVMGAASIDVILTTGEKYSVNGLRGLDAERDLALLQIAGFHLPSASLGDSNAVRLGEQVVVIGSPLGIKELRNTVTTGIVSGIRVVDGSKIFQMDAAVSKGNSGGPVANIRGEVIGITVAKISDGESLNFMVPINYARGLLHVPFSQGLAALPRGATPAQAEKAELPASWKTASGEIRNIEIDGSEMRIFQPLGVAIRREGGSNTARLRRAGDHWEGEFEVRITCRTFIPVPRRKLCPAIKGDMRITKIANDAIEGVGDLPPWGAFNCLKCAYDSPLRSAPFTWTPVGSP